MSLKELSAKELYDLLKKEGLFKYKGHITFKLGDTSTVIKAKDTIGNSLQEWLEIKAFNSSANPAFDIANFDSYCESLRNEIYRLDADYLILAYDLDDITGIISIKNMWLKKVWEITRESNEKTINYSNQKRNGIQYKTEKMVF